MFGGLLVSDLKHYVKTGYGNSLDIAFTHVQYTNLIIIY